MHDKQILENKAIRIHKKFQDLIIALSSAYVEGEAFIKDRSVYNDLLDALSQTLSRFKPKTTHVVNIDYEIFMAGMQNGL